MACVLKEQDLSRVFLPCLQVLSRELSRIQNQLKKDRITPKQVGDLQALPTARKSKENKVILTMTINAKSQWQCFGRRSRKRMLHPRQMTKSVITIVRRFIQLTRCPLRGRQHEEWWAYLDFVVSLGNHDRLLCSLRRIFWFYKNGVWFKFEDVVARVHIT